MLDRSIADWPYRVAWAVRRRGGSFNVWFTVAVIFNIILVSLAYYIKWRPQPILAEAEASCQTQGAP